MKSILALGIVSAMLLGCGPGNSFNGKVGGVEFKPTEAVFSDLRDSKDNSIQAVMLVMTASKDICATLKANRDPKNAIGMSITILRTNADNKVLSPDLGDYSISKELKLTPNTAFQGGTASFNKSDANCSNTLSSDQSQSESGVVKVTQLKLGAEGRMEGTFDITFGTQKDKTTGAFSATYCDFSTAFAAAENGTKRSCE